MIKSIIKYSMLSEEFEQRELAIFLDMTELLWCHVPNGGARSKGVAGALKAQGVKPGVPDVLIFNKPNNPRFPNYCGLAIELKRFDSGKITQNQKVWLNALAKHGWLTSVCHGHKAAIQLINEVYRLRL